jgi:hypothetical protein
MAWVGSPCPGDTASFVINPVAGATSYMWYVAGTGWTGSSTSTTLNTIAGTKTGPIVVVAFNACGQGESHTMHIVPNLPPPTPSISVYTPPCTGTTSAVFTASGVGTSYSWTVSGAGWSGSSSTSTLICYGRNRYSTYYLQFFQCMREQAIRHFQNYTQTPVTSFSVATHSTLVTVNDLVTFTGTAPVGSTYTWYFTGGTATPGIGAGPQNVNWIIPGTKTITLIVDNNGCNSTYSDTVLVRDLTGTSIVNNPAINVSINPNPNNGTFELQFSKPISGSLTVKIMAMDGRTVYDKAYSGTANNKIAVKASDLASGDYLVNISTDEGSVTKKISVSK